MTCSRCTRGFIRCDNPECFICGSDRDWECVDATVCENCLRIEPGVYLHKKGGRYRVLFEAVDESSGVDVVVYVSMTDGRVWVRPSASWSEIVSWPDSTLRPRFLPAV